MNLLAIYGSPRKNGNTDLLLDKIIEGARVSGGINIEKIYVRDMNILPCKGCHSCGRTGLCVINDDMHKIYNKLETADCVVVSAPIFFYGLPGQLKLLVDRCQCYWARKYLPSKKNVETKKSAQEKFGIFISVGGTKGKNLFEGTKLTIKYFFNVFDIVYYKDLLIRQIDGYQEILDSPDILQQAHNLGKEISQL